jgi:Zn-dependent protease with chaperone function
VIALAAVPFAVGVLAAVYGRRAAARIAPAVAAVSLTALALTVALASGLLLCLGAAVALAEVPTPVSGTGAPDVLRDNIPLPPGVGLVGGLIAALLMCSATVHSVRVTMRARRSSTAGAALPSASGLVLVDDSSVFAYAIPGRNPRIVASSGMLRSLSGSQRRALLAHEQAHLRHRHHVYVQLGRLAAAANPLMRPVSRAIDLAVERWADESAARAVGDPVTVARAVAAAALARTAVPADALGGAQTGVVERVHALLQPQRRQRSTGAALSAATALCWIAALAVATRVHGLLELAETVAGRP